MKQYISKIKLSIILFFIIYISEIHSKREKEDLPRKKNVIEVYIFLLNKGSCKRS